MICLAERPVTVTVKGKAKPVLKHDAAGANRALELLGKAVGFVPPEPPTINGTGRTVDSAIGDALRAYAKKTGQPWLLAPPGWDPRKEG